MSERKLSSPALVRDIGRPVSWFIDGRQQLRFIYALEGRTQIPKRPWSTSDPVPIILVSPRRRMIEQAINGIERGHLPTGSARKLLLQLGAVMGSASDSALLKALGLDARSERSRRTQRRLYAIASERRARRLLDPSHRVWKQVDGLIADSWKLARSRIADADKLYGRDAGAEIDSWLEMATTKSLPEDHVDDGLVTLSDLPRIYDRTSVLHAFIDLAAQVREATAVRANRPR